MNLISVRLVEATHRVREKIVSKMWDRRYVLSLIEQNEVPHVIIDDQILLVYSIDTPWYSQQSIVSELLVLRIRPGNTDSLSTVDSLLMDLCDEAQAQGTVVGGALSDKPRALCRRYSKLGYSEQDSPELVKWRHQWVEP